MSDVDAKIAEALRKDNGYDAARSDRMREELTKAYQENFQVKLRMTRILTWLFLLVGVAMMVGGASKLMEVNDTKDMFWCAIVVLIGYESTVLIKIWYWVVNVKLNVVKELKGIELQVAELAAAAGRKESAGG